MTQPSKTAPNAESGQEVAKISPSVSRFAAAVWEKKITRPTYTVEGASRQVAEWHARIQYGGRRKWIPLGSNDRRTAARTAARFWEFLVKHGWERALAECCPDRQKPEAVATVGQFLAAVEAAGGMRARTLANYGYALRRIAADIAGTAVRGGKRFDPTRPVWREPADAVSLRVLTGQNVNRWRVGFVAKAGRDALAQQRAKRSANSYIRNARSLFAEETLARLSVKLPKPLPFEGVKLERNTGSTRYVSTFNVNELIAQARAELREADPDVYLTILLAVAAGLRRGEVDALQWQQVDFAQAAVRVMPLRHALKTDSSEGVVYVDPALLSELAAVRATRPAASLYVVAPEAEARPTRAAQYYRAAETFDRATAWLRRHGVDGPCPLHQCRKEFGSILAARADINVASRMLRHSNLGTTANFYVDARRSAVVPLGAMLNSETTATK